MLSRIRGYIQALFYLPLVWYNIGNASSARVLRDLYELASVVDKKGRTPRLMVFCEAADRHDVIRRWCSETGWKPILKRGQGAAAVAAVAHPDFAKRITKIQWTLAVKGRNVGSPGAGPSFVGDKTILWIRFGRGLMRNHILGTHYTASIERRKLPNHPARVEHAKAQTLALRNQVKPRWGTTWVFGDFNMLWENAILQPLRKIGLQNIKTNRPTHGKRRIDLVLYRFWYPKHLLAKLRVKLPKSNVTATTIDLSSDHHGVVVHQA